MRCRQSDLVMVAADGYYVQVARVALGLTESLPAAGILRMSIRGKESVFAGFTRTHGTPRVTFGQNVEILKKLLRGL